MGVPTTPQDAAPAYDDVFGDHPVNRYPAAGSASSYAAVAQNDDVELGTHMHTHANSSSPTPATTEPESLVQTLAGVFKPKPHVHCEQCDVMTAARERREHKAQCCSLVAATFMVFFALAFVFAIIAMGLVYRQKKHDG